MCSQAGPEQGNGGQPLEQSADRQDDHLMGLPNCNYPNT